MSRFLPDADATAALGAALAQNMPAAGAVLYLHGELGAGKTTLARGLVRALGYTGSVRSPTYTLLEPYDIGGRAVVHLDLYRLAGAEELDYLGIRELDAPGTLVIVEWPERGNGHLPPPDLEITLTLSGQGRGAVFQPRSSAGEVWRRSISQV